MGLLFSKPKQVAPTVTTEPYPVQAPNNHAHHPSTVSYDFNTSKGQIRAIRAFQELDDTKSPEKPKKRKIRWK